MTTRRVNHLLAYILLFLMPFGMSWGLPGCTACSKPCEDQPFSESVKAYLLGFKPGSYWIYQNTQNGDIDSVYLVSETVNSNLGSSPICRVESAYVELKGFAGDKQFTYAIDSNNNIISTAALTGTGFYGDYDTDNSAPLTIAKQLFQQVVTLDHCCVSGRASCYKPTCSEKYFRFMQLALAREIGIVRWKADNYPPYGNVTYELIRYKIIR